MVGKVAPNTVYHVHVCAYVHASRGETTEASMTIPTGTDAPHAHIYVEFKNTTILLVG